MRAHRAGGVDDEQRVRLLERRGDLARDRPRVRARRAPGRALEAPARVGAAVEAPAGRALVDPPQPERAGAQQALGEPVGLLDLVGERRPVDAAVRHPAGRRAGAGALARVGRLASPGRLLERGRQVDVLVELLQLAGARLLARALERVLQRADVGATVGVAAAPSGARRRRPDRRPGRAGRRPAPVRRRRRLARRRVGRADDVAVAPRPLRQRLVLAVGDPDQLGVEVVERLDVVGAEDRRARSPAAGRARRA